MGMAAGQARLLSITSRMSDNELRAQVINNNKMRLATQSSQVSEAYVQALNEAQMMFTNYDANNNATYQQLTFNALTAYNPYNNQYALINASNNIIVSEADATNFKNSNGNKNAFLASYGLEYNTTYFDKLNTQADIVMLPQADSNGQLSYSNPTGFSAAALKQFYEGSYSDGQQILFNRQTIVYSDASKNLHSYEGTLGEQAYYTYMTELENYSGAKENFDGYMNEAVKYLIENNFAGYNNASSAAEKKRTLNTIITNLTNNHVLLPNSDLTKLTTGISNVSDTASYKYTADEGYFVAKYGNASSPLYALLWKDPKDENSNYYLVGKFNNGVLQYYNQENSAFEDSSNKESTNLNFGGLTYSSTAISTSDIYFIEDVDDDAHNGEAEVVVTDVISNWRSSPYNQFYISTNCDEFTTTYEIAEEEQCELLDEYCEILKTNLSSWCDFENLSSALPTSAQSEYDAKLGELNRATQSLMQLIFKTNENKKLIDNNNVELSTDVLKLIKNNIYDIGSLYDDYSQYFKPEFFDIFKNILLDNVMDAYGEPNYTWIDIYNPSENGEAKYNWYSNLFDRMSQGFSVLLDGLASSPEWIKFAFESGIVTMEQVDSYQNWNKMIYTNCSDITEQTNTAAITKAEAEYNAAMNKIENKDKRYDLELKNIDTEHNSLQVEYDSIKTAIDKNIERTFKIYS